MYTIKFYLILISYYNYIFNILIINFCSKIKNYPKNNCSTVSLNDMFKYKR